MLKSRHPLVVVAWLLTVWCWLSEAAMPGGESPPRTTLSDPTMRYVVAPKPYAVLARGDVELVVVDNSAVEDATLPGHRSGYSGVASLKHKRRPENCFVPAYAGLNFEHIHDGTTQERRVLFEPRNAPMELRLVDPYTVELYQPPTPTWKLESALRYELLEDGAIQMTVECIPRERVFRNGYIGLFWASYIHKPESTEIYFRGYDEMTPAEVRWIRALSPQHGVAATHLAADDNREFAHDKDFPLSLVFNRSQYRYVEPWYYGVTHGMALVFIFRPKDRVRFAQSPSGGGQGNPAWDFQYFIEPYEVGHRYQMVMRLVYVPFQSPEQIADIARKHLAALAAMD
ncbi:MAG: hypothetical protein NZ899_11935 [Thermoguttaceae bacterium]|nr:hypothetical protein [Thermoguttaceae bacterium]